MQTELAVVLVNWNQGAATLAAVERIRAWRLLTPRCWVIDNGSSDGSRELLAPLVGSRLALLANGFNAGFGYGNNRALERIGAGYVLLLNSDADIGEDDVAELVGALDADPGLAVVCPLVSRRGAPARDAAAGGRDISLYFDTRLRASDLPPGARQPVPVVYVPGAVALLRRSALTEVGLFDERYFYGGEMADLCSRLGRAGFRVAVVPSARAWHDVGLAGELRQRLYPYYVLRNRFLFIRKFRRRTRLPLFVWWSAYGGAKAALALARGRPAAARLALLALADGWRGRFGNANTRVLA